MFTYNVERFTDGAANPADCPRLYAPCAPAVDIGSMCVYFAMCTRLLTRRQVAAPSANGALYVYVGA